MLSVIDLKVQADNFVLGPLILSFASRKRHIILGPSGSGKSVLLKALAGIISPVSGDIVCQHSDGACSSILPFGPERRHIAWLSQENVLFPHLSVRDNIRYSIRINTALPGAESRYDQLVDAFGLTQLLDQRTQSLSGGEIQRVALARTIVSGRRIMVLDEPFNGLHPGMRRELWELLSSIQSHFELTVILVTHDIEEACALGDTLTVLINGRIEQTGTAESVYANPASLAVSHYFGHRNVWHGTVYPYPHVGYFQTETFKLLLPTGCTQEFSSPKSVYLGLHPEKLRCRSESESTQGLPGYIQTLTCLGGRFQMTVVSDFWPVPIHVMASRPLEPSQLVWLEIEKDAVFWIRNISAV